MNENSAWPAPPYRTLIFALSACLAIIRPAAAQLQFETLKSFIDGTDGAHPAGPMVQAADGWMYGLTSRGSSGQCGSAFRFNPSDPSGPFQTIWMGGGGGPGCYVQDGGLVLAGDGNMYFSTLDGGPTNTGRVFQVSPAGIVTVLVDYFPFAGGRMYAPHYGLVVGADGALYGAASRGGPNDSGGIFRVGLDGTLSDITTFPPEFYFIQVAALTTGTDGNLYGTAAAGGGVLYRVDPASGSLEILYQFAAGPDGLYPNGYFPRGRLLEVPPLPGHDIALVGVTQGGGTATYRGGVVYRLDVAEGSTTFSKLHEFISSLSEYLGETPAAGLVRDADGTLYGTTAGYAGFLGPTFVGPGVPPSGEFGTVYRIGTNGVVSKLVGGIIQPFAPLLIGTDGNLYGTSFNNSDGPPPSASLGSIFRLVRPIQMTLSVINAPESATYGTSFTVSTSGGSGTGAVTFAATEACANTAGGALITMTSGTGICMITATKAGDATYNAAMSLPVTVTPLKASQTIVFVALADKTLGDPPFTVGATGGASGNPVTFITTTPTVCTSAGVDGATITLAATGTCTVRASQAGDANYNAAADVEQSFLVQGGSTFAGLFPPWNPPGPGTYNGMDFSSGRVYKMNSTLPVKWGYSINGTRVDSSRATIELYPIVKIYGPLATCGDIDGTETDTVLSYSGPGTTTTTYDPTSKMWQRNVKLDSSFQGDKCYQIQVYDPVSRSTSPLFPFKTTIR